MVDKRTLEKYEKEAREKNRESWYLSWALDTNLEGWLTHFSNLLATLIIFYFIYKNEKKARR